MKVGVQVGVFGLIFGLIFWDIDVRAGTSENSKEYT